MQTFAQIAHGIKWNYIYMVTDILTKFGFIFSVPVPTFIFPCPRKNSCVGREKNIPGQRRIFLIPSFSEFPPVEVLWPLILVFCPFHIHLLLKRLTDLWCKNTTIPRNFQGFREKYLKRMRRKKNRRLPETRAAYWMLFLIPFVESLFDFFNGRKAAAKIFRQSLT